MAGLTVTRSIHAPVGVVFQTVADARRLAQAISGVSKIEYLSVTTSGVGTRFRQTRVVNGRERILEFKVTEYVKNERVRIVNDSHDTLWDSVVTVAPSGRNTKLTLHVEARANGLLSRLMLPLVCRRVRTSAEKDLDGVKSLCERVKN